MSISRRSVLLGTAAGLATTATALPLAIKAGAVREALASDARLDLLCDAWWETLEIYNKIEADYSPRLTRAIYHEYREASDRAWAAHDKAWDYLMAEPPLTVRGAHQKLEIIIEDIGPEGEAIAPEFHYRALRRLAADLERLAGRAA